MLSKVTLANTAGEDIVLHEDTQNSSRLISNAQGLFGVGPLRISKRVLPQADGDINETRFTEGRVIQLSGEVWSNVSIERAIEEYRQIVAAALQTLSAPALLKWTEGSSGQKLQQLVKLDSDPDPVLSEAAAKISYPIQFHASDPRAYSQVLHTILSPKLVAGGGGLVFPAKFPWKFLPSGQHSVTVANKGNRNSPLVFKVHGYAQNPKILRVSDGRGVVLSGTIEDGNFWEVDGFSRTVKLNGVTNELGSLNSAATSWTALLAPPSPVEEVYQLFAENYDKEAFLEVSYRDAYA